LLLYVSLQAIAALFNSVSAPAATITSFVRSCCKQFVVAPWQCVPHKARMPHMSSLSRAVLVPDIIPQHHVSDLCFHMWPAGSFPLRGPAVSAAESGIKTGSYRVHTVSQECCDALPYLLCCMTEHPGLCCMIEHLILVWNRLVLLSGTLET
jgi:hypothetical protein